MPQNGRAHVARRRRGGSGATRTAKVTVTIPGDLLAAAAARVQSGDSPSISAYVSDALARQVQSDSEGDAYLALLARLDEELGPPSEADFEWARQFIRR